MLFTKPPRVTVITGDPLESEADAIVAPALSGQEEPVIGGVIERIDSMTGGTVRRIVARGAFKASPGETLKMAVNGRQVVLAGLGRDPSLEDVRKAFARGVREAIGKGVSRIAVILSGLDSEKAVEALISTLLTLYKPTAFKSRKQDVVEEVLIDVDGKVATEAMAVAEGVYLARDIANAPPNELAPRRLADYIKKLFSNMSNVKVRVLEYKDLVDMGFGGIVSVGKGSAEKPVLVIVEYGGSGDSRPVALIGKTIVFDTGGINLKPSQSMFDMRADKAGGAAVLGALWAIARLGLKVDVVALIPAAINAPSGEAYLPSDVIKMWDGTRVEVTNTDAEGRLTLADAIAYAANELDAVEIIDLATLTGAAAVALGPLIAAAFTRSDKVYKMLEEASRRAGEKIWRMPLEDSYKVALEKKAPLGDVANAAMRYGGAICAALFLERFSHGKQYAHLDIAGPGIGLGGEAVDQPPYWPRGLAPGWGVRLLVEYLKMRASGQE